MEVDFLITQADGGIYLQELKFRVSTVVTAQTGFEQPCYLDVNIEYELRQLGKTDLAYSV